SSCAIDSRGGGGRWGRGRGRPAALRCLSRVRAWERAREWGFCQGGSGLASTAASSPPPVGRTPRPPLPARPSPLRTPVLHPRAHAIQPPSGRLLAPVRTGPARGGLEEAARLPAKLHDLQVPVDHPSRRRVALLHQALGLLLDRTTVIPARDDELPGAHG